MPQVTATFLVHSIMPIVHLLLMLVFISESQTTPTPTFETLQTKRSNNGTLSNSSSWVGEPSRRGTFSLLLSCFTTLFLCVWTALRLNIPSKTSKWLSFLQQIGYMVVAMLFPELVLYQAWSQYWAARTLMQEINQIGQGRKSDCGLTLRMGERIVSSADHQIISRALAANEGHRMIAEKINKPIQTMDFQTKQESIIQNVPFRVPGQIPRTKLPRLQ